MEKIEPIIPLRRGSWVALCGILSAVLGVIVLGGWFAGSPAVVQVSRGLPPMSPSAAWAFIFAGASLYLTAYRPGSRTALVTSSALNVIGFGILILHIFELDLAMELKLAPQFMHIDPSFQLSINGALCFLFTGAALALLNIRTAVKEFYLFAIVLALLAFVISALALYGHMLGVELAYGWGSISQMAVHSAIGMLIVSTGIVIAGAQRYAIHDGTFEQLSSGVLIMAAAGVALIAITSSILGILPLYDSQQQSLRARLYDTLKHNAFVADQYLSNLEHRVAGMTNRSTANRLLENFLKNKDEKDRYAAATAQTLAQSIKDSPEILGVARFDANWMTVVRSGLTLPVHPWEMISGAIDRPLVSHPLHFGTRMVYLIRVPVFSSSRIPIGTDIYLMNFAPVKKIIERGPTVDEHGRIYLGFKRGRDTRSIRIVSGASQTGKRATQQFSAVRAAVRRALRSESGNLEPRIYSGKSTLALYTPIGRANWALISAFDVKDLGARQNMQLLKVLCAVSAIAALATVALYFLLRGLLVRVSGLQSKIALGNESLAKELIERKHAERSAREQAAKVKAIVNNLVDGIITFDAIGTITSFSLGAEILFGYRADEVVGSAVSTLLPAMEKINWGDGDFAADLPNAIHRKFGKAWELIGRRRDGKLLPVELSVGIMDDDEGRMYTGIVHDLTERKITEQELEESVHEKELLLKEIHHRVKNNLQVISSIFSLQTRRTDDQSVREILKESQGRILTIAVLHETLYKSGNLSRIYMGDYLKELIQNLMRSYVLEDRLFVDFHGEGVYLELDRAIPCGLIINELLTNVFKHAFPNDSVQREKKVTVTVSRVDDRSLKLTVVDNGVGFSDEKDGESRSLGLRLVKTLTSQLRGELSVSHPGGIGSRFDIVFPMSDGVSRKLSFEERIV